MLALKGLLSSRRVSQAELARAVNLSPATIAQLVNKEIWPTNPTRDALQASITAELAARNIEVLPSHFEPIPAVDAALSDELTGRTIPSPLEIIMLLRKQSLTQAARKHYSLFRDPFNEDVGDAEDVFSSPDIRYVREYLWNTARMGGFCAVVGESGAGKTTLLRDLRDRVRREDAPVVLIEPYVLGMEDNDKRGKTLKSGAIADAIISALAPLERPKVTMEAKSRQLHRLLKDSRRAGYSHCLIIEEAHGLPIPTIKHLKRFFELEDGFKKLLSIVLIGQPELKQKLSERSPEVREVVQRCEVVELSPLDSKLEEYLRFKFNRVGRNIDEVFDKDAMDGIRKRLIFARSGKSERETISLMYPLMVNNLVTSSLNLGASLGLGRITGDLIREA
jgi:type II secretory pathway predicted ATPase ExeA